jgi:hypothetical protein
MSAMRRPWRRWSAKQLLLFVLETLVLSMAIMWLGAGNELPRSMQLVASIVGRIILLIGALVVLGWVGARRRSS